MASVNLSRLKHHECAKCGWAILGLPRKDRACGQCGCTLFRVRRPTEEEEDLFVAEYLKEEERERAREEREQISEQRFRVAAVATVISGSLVVLGWLATFTLAELTMYAAIFGIPVWVLAYCGFFRRPSDWGLLIVAGIVVLVMEACGLGPFSDP